MADDTPLPNHEHDPVRDHMFLGAEHDENARRTLWVVWLTVVMMVVEIITGYLTGSMALLADGIHMATHAGVLGVAVLAYRYARRHAANRDFSWGTGKVGDLAGFASAIMLGVIALGVGVESIMRLFRPAEVAFGEATIVAVVGLAVNIVSAFLLMGGRHAGHEHSHDNNLRSAYMHVLADALTSVLAIIALLAGWFLGWIWLDPVVAIVGALLISRWAGGLIRDTSAILLDRTDVEIAAEIADILDSYGDTEITDLHVWRVGPQSHAAIVSVRAADADAVIIRARLAPLRKLAHLTIEHR